MVRLRRSRNAASVKPFRLVKYLSLSSLVVILVYTLFLSSFISQRAKTILAKKTEQYAYVLTENLNQQVFFQFTLPTVMTEGELRLSRPSQAERLDKVVRNAIHGYAVERVNIYNPQEILTYSTEPESLGEKAILGEPFKRAMEGESTSFLVDEGNSFLGFTWGSGPRRLKTFMPMWVEKPGTWKRGTVLGVFEIIQDVSEDYEAIQRFQWIVVGSSALFVGIVFISMLPIAKRAERIISARAQESEKLQVRLHQSERLAALGEMVAGVSHEIRNPLGIIRSTAELLDSRIEDERHRRLTGIIVEEATRLNDILTEFLDFARPKTLRLSNCRIEELVERNLRNVEPECQRRHVSLEKQYHAGDYSLQADADLLYRALINVVANALQAMPQGGTLRVQTELHNARGAPQVELRIQDSGQGIPTELHQKVFNPFFTTREKGTGLGLAIVQSIIGGHHGAVEVDSKIGQGTAIIIRLPLSQAEFQEDGATAEH
ncbi:MAG TPA: two-component sensor histidine kinase [Syntrophobacteraceae bacterium]|nr:two-component sensor histidine kinase [Syntrophobacteraceae bacterium]